MPADTYLTNKAEFKRGQTDGINGTIHALTRIINGNDKGEKALQNRELEKVRRVFLMWRDHIIESRDTNKKAYDILVETKKIMDIKIPDNLK